MKLILHRELDGWKYWVWAEYDPKVLRGHLLRMKRIPYQKWDATGPDCSF